MRYELFAIQHIRLLYMIRVAIVMSFILLTVRIFNIPYGYWALITAVTILGTIPYIGGVLSKAKERILGTVIGGVIGLALFLIPVQWHWTHHLMFLALLIGSMYYTQEKYTYAALIVAVTLVVVAGGGPEDFDAAIWRVLNVLWAGILTILASLYIFPTRATSQFTYLLNQFLQESCLYYHRHNQEMALNIFDPMHADKLASIIDKQAGLLPHVLKEAGENSSTYSDILLIEKRIYADLETLISTQWDTQQGKDKISNMPDLTHAKEQLANQFQRLGEQVAKKSILVVLAQDITILSLQPKRHPHPHDDTSDISYFGYLWLNRELARQFSQLTYASSKLFS
ncbi:FUSC family protein [Photobacterium nomapromontoriensis]|uniref:FUSC family protein n=1 Tax=Photobacterium nomapromontoriensis TaxID=2910237 RepID=UPI003D12C416